MNQLLKILCIFTILLSGLTVPVISASLKFDVKDYTTIPVGKNEIYDEGRIRSSSPMMSAAKRQPVP